LIYSIVSKSWITVPMLLRSLALLVATALSLAACVTTAKEAHLKDGYRLLSGAEIKELVIGRTVEGRYINRKGTWAEFHAPGGVVSNIESDGTHLGTWEIRGNEICYSFPDEPIPNCIEVAEKRGGYVHFLANGPYRGNLGGEWISITPGNVKNLPLE
jgi:hypothetical protein